MSVAFKEWAVICDLLRTGRQSVILRKGGIAEGRAGFAFEHPTFYLLPTRFHEQIAQTTLPAETPLPPEPPLGEWGVDACATVVEHLVVDSLEGALALAPLHHWSEETVRARFAYDDAPGVSVALVRVERLSPEWRFPDAPRYGGCRSWVQIPEPPADLKREPALDDAAFEQVAAMFGRLAIKSLAKKSLAKS